MDCSFLSNMYIHPPTSPSESSVDSTPINVPATLPSTIVDAVGSIVISVGFKFYRDSYWNTCYG